MVLRTSATGNDAGDRVPGESAGVHMRQVPPDEAADPMMLRRVSHAPMSAHANPEYAMAALRV